MRFFGLVLVVFGVLAILIPIWFTIMVALGGILPFLLIGGIAWAGFRLTRGSRRRRWSQFNWQQPGRVPFSGSSRWGARSWGASRPTPSPLPTPTPIQPRQQLPELPIDLQVKVEQIRRKTEVLLTYAPRFQPFSQDLHVVRQTAAEYLPRTLEAFQALAPDDADRVIGENGKTARQELKEQLDLLDAKLDEIASDLQRRDVDRLLANRRFLEERFGTRSA